MEKIWIASYAEGVPESVSFQDIALHQGLTRAAGRFPDKPAVIFFGKSINYLDLNLMVSKFASALQGMGVKPGDKVALVLPNLVQMIVGVFAVLRLGAIAVPNNPLYTDRELEHQFSDSESQLLICWDTLVPRMIQLRGKTAIKQIISCHLRDYLPFPLKQVFPFVKRELHLKTPSAKDVYEFTDLLKRHEPISHDFKSDMDDVALLIYTGGTTGVSKGAQQTHRNISYNCQQMAAWSPGFHDGGEVMLGVLPFFHSYAMTVVLNMSVLRGWCNVVIPKPEAKTILDAIQKYRVSIIPGVPTLFNALINHPGIKKYDISSVKGCFSAAAPLPLETIRGFKGLTGILISEAYGLTEAGPCTHSIPLGGREKPGCIGLPLPSTDAKIVDVNDYEREINVLGEAGELCVKGPQIMKGYVNRPDETAATLRDGWLLTGDMATVDEEGYFTIVDRKKDMIISGGFNIYPREIDEVLFTHPKILEACSIGIPDAYSGERVKVYVVLKDGQEVTEQEIIDYCKERLVKYKVPKFVEFSDQLPKSAVGKILRKELRAIETARRR
jgi:long-chain acyl-CoA synthetase